VAKKSGISIGSLIWIAVIGYIFFGGDDNDSKEVTVRDQETTEIVETLKETGQELKSVIKEKGIEIVDQIKAEKEAETPKPEPPPKKEKSMVAEPEKQEELKPLTDEPKSEGMKRL
jgi:hypothetical protein